MSNRRGFLKGLFGTLAAAASGLGFSRRRETATDVDGVLTEKKFDEFMEIALQPPRRKKE